MSTIVITGAGGYIGSMLVERLLDDGHFVVGIDRFFFGKELLGPEILNHSHFKALQKDIRKLKPEDVKGADVVIDLAGLSNDPSCDLRPQLTFEINHKGCINVAEVAKKAGVPRYIFSSSCSVYGTGESQALTEESNLNPVSNYAKSKIDVEKHIRELGTPEFTVTILRNATVYGISKRMRFDLVVNLMTLHAWRDRKIVIMGQGRQWRPLVNIQDVVQAFCIVLEADRKLIDRQCFNVGSNEQNFQVLNIANILRGVLPDTELIMAPDDADKRTYNVSFDKISKILGFKAKGNPADAAAEIINGFKYGILDPTDRRCYTINHYKFLMDVERVITEIGQDGRIF